MSVTSCCLCSAYNRTFSYYGTKLRYAAVRINLSLSTQELNYIKGFPVMDSWESFVKDQVMCFICQVIHHEVIQVIQMFFICVD
jgi:hypothetical protein